MRTVTLAAGYEYDLDFPTSIHAEVDELGPVDLVLAAIEETLWSVNERLYYFVHGHLPVRWHLRLAMAELGSTVEGTSVELPLEEGLKLWNAIGVPEDEGGGCNGA